MSLAYFVDVQGTLLSDEDKSPLPGALELIEFLNSSKIPFVIVTNNTKKKSEDFKHELRVKGFKFSEDQYLDPFCILSQIILKKSLYPFGPEAFFKVISSMGFNINKLNPDKILVASYENFSNEDYAKMIEYAINGASLVGMHATSTYAKNAKRYPGVGAIMQMISYASGKDYQIIGKASEAFFSKALELLKRQDEKLNFSDICMISDDAIGDLIGAKELGIKSSLVLSGKVKTRTEVQNFADKIDEIFPSVENILASLKAKHEKS